MPSRMVRCSCPCRGFVAPATQRRHLEGNGTLRVIIAQLESEAWQEHLKEIRRERKRNARQQRESSRAGQPPIAVYMCDFVSNHLRVQLVAIPTSDDFQIQPDAIGGHTEREGCEEVRYDSPEFSSAIPHPEHSTSYSNADDETASRSSVEDDRSEPSESSESEDEGYISSSQDTEWAQNVPDSSNEHLPLMLQGLSIADIAKSQWLAESFLVGECASGIRVSLGIG